MKRKVTQLYCHYTQVTTYSKTTKEFGVYYHLFLSNFNSFGNYNYYLKANLDVELNSIKFIEITFRIRA